MAFVVNLAVTHQQITPMLSLTVGAKLVLCVLLYSADLCEFADR